MRPSTCSTRDTADVLQPDPVRGKPLARLPIGLASVRAENDVRAPGLQRQRERGRLAAEHRQTFVTPLPAVAVRAMEDRTAVAFANARHLGQVVFHAGGEQQVARSLPPPVRERDAEPGAFPPRALHGHGTELDPVRHEFLARSGAEIRRRDAVARQVAVERGRPFVARLAAVADQHMTAAPAEHQRGAQPCGAAADDDHVVRGHASAVARPSPAPTPAPLWGYADAARVGLCDRIRIR